MTTKLISPSGPPEADVMIVGEAPGRSEVERGIPFIGQSGMELTRLLDEVGFDRREIRITNVCSQRPPGNDISKFFYNKTQAKKAKAPCVSGRYPHPPILEGMKELFDEISRVQPKLIIALGDTALWALTGESGITKWRGSMLNYGLDPSIRVLPTYHPAAVLRMWKWRPVLKYDLQRAYEYRDQPWPEPDYDFTIGTDIDSVMDVLRGLERELDAVNKPLRLAVDIETLSRHLDCIGLAWSRRHAICIPLLSLDSPEGFWDAEREYQIVSKLRTILLHPNAYIIGQNFIFDCQYLARYWGFAPRVSFDTMLAQHVLLPGDMPKGLDFLSSIYCDYHRYWKDEGKELDTNLDENQRWEYNCKDCCATWESAVALESQLESEQLFEQFSFLMRMFPYVLRTMLRGVRRDANKQSQFAMELLNTMNRYTAWFERVVPEDILPRSKTPWYNSTSQTKKLFYTALGFQPIFHPQRKGPTVDDDALKKLAQREPALSPICLNLVRYRQLRTFYGTFIGAKADHDGRFRSTYNLAGTETMRLSSSKDAFGFGLNLQNIPKGDG